MPHFFIPPVNITGDKFLLSGDEAHHLARVRRVAPGDAVNLFDGTGAVYTGRVESVQEDAIRGVILSKEQGFTAKLPLILYSAVPKGDRFDWLVEKAVELGVASIVPMITSRSVLREVTPAKLDRYRRLVQSASKQCGRPDIMVIDEPRAFPEAVTAVEGTLAVIPWEGEEKVTVEEACRLRKISMPVSVFIGPEGGFTFDEVQLARERGIIPVTLGPRILRVETAALLSTILILNTAGEYAR